MTDPQQEPLDMTDVDALRAKLGKAMERLDEARSWLDLVAEGRPEGSAVRVLMAHIDTLLTHWNKETP